MLLERLLPDSAGLDASCPLFTDERWVCAAGDATLWAAKGAS
jgi:hypothetical protein